MTSSTLGRSANWKRGFLMLSRPLYFTTWSADCVGKLASLIENEAEVGTIYDFYGSLSVAMCTSVDSFLEVSWVGLVASFLPSNQLNCQSWAFSAAFALFSKSHYLEVRLHSVVSTFHLLYWPSDKIFLLSLCWPKRWLRLLHSSIKLAWERSLSRLSLRRLARI